MEIENQKKRKCKEMSKTEEAPVIIADTRGEKTSRATHHKTLVEKDRKVSLEAAWKVTNMANLIVGHRQSIYVPVVTISCPWEEAV